MTHLPLLNIKKSRINAGYLVDVSISLKAGTIPISSGILENRVMPVSADGFMFSEQVHKNQNWWCICTTEPPDKHINRWLALSTH
jgi:hypothetical protein